jgi:Protein of unknown function (DUF5131)
MCTFDGICIRLSGSLPLARRLVCTDPGLSATRLDIAHEVTAKHLKMLPSDWGDGCRNVWLGVTGENQDWFDQRRRILQGIPAAVQFISEKPAMGPLQLPRQGPVRDWLTGLNHQSNLLQNCSFIESSHLFAAEFPSAIKPLPAPRHAVNPHCAYFPIGAHDDQVSMLLLPNQVRNAAAAATTRAAAQGCVISAKMPCCLF